MYHKGGYAPGGDQKRAYQYGDRLHCLIPSKYFGQLCVRQLLRSACGCRFHFYHFFNTSWAACRWARRGLRYVRALSGIWDSSG